MYGTVGAGAGRAAVVVGHKAEVVHISHKLPEILGQEHTRDIALGHKQLESRICPVHSMYNNQLRINESQAKILSNMVKLTPCNTIAASSKE